MTEPTYSRRQATINALRALHEELAAIEDHLKGLRKPKDLSALLPAKWFPVSTLIGGAGDAVWVAEQLLLDRIQELEDSAEDGENLGF